jgi:hypothetical protein
MQHEMAHFVRHTEAAAVTRRGGGDHEHRRGAVPPGPGGARVPLGQGHRDGHHPDAAALQRADQCADRLVGRHAQDLSGALGGHDRVTSRGRRGAG